LITPFTSAVGVVNSELAAASYSSHAVSDSTLDIFDNYYHLQSVDIPTKIIAGSADRITPYSQAVQLMKVLPNPLPMITLDGAGHNDIWMPPYERLVIENIGWTL
jgi:pimeloyl-ACP methyl ester carboxylesterase